MRQRCDGCLRRLRRNRKSLQASSGSVMSPPSIFEDDVQQRVIFGVLIFGAQEAFVLEAGSGVMECVRRRHRYGRSVCRRGQPFFSSVMKYGARGGSFGDQRATALTLQIHTRESAIRCATPPGHPYGSALCSSPGSRAPLDRRRVDEIFRIAEDDAGSAHGIAQAAAAATIRPTSRAC